MKRFSLTPLISSGLSAHVTRRLCADEWLPLSDERPTDGVSAMFKICYKHAKESAIHLWVDSEHLQNAKSRQQITPQVASTPAASLPFWSWTSDALGTNSLSTWSVLFLVLRNRRATSAMNTQQSCVQNDGARK